MILIDLEVRNVDITNIFLQLDKLEIKKLFSHLESLKWQSRKYQDVKFALSLTTTFSCLAIVAPAYSSLDFV